MTGLAVELGDVEARLGARLPRALRAWLLAGSPWVCDEVPAPDGWPHGDTLRVTRVYGLADGSLPAATWSWFSGRIPDVAVPMASTGCGAVIVVGFDGFDAGRVWVCDTRRTRTEPRLAGMRADLLARGLDDELDDDGVVWHWERLEPARRSWRLGFADAYELASVAVL